MLEKMWRKQNLFTLLVGIEKSMEVLRKLKIYWPYDPAIPLLGIYPEKTNSKRYMTPMFIAALFTIAKAWRQPKCPSTVEWIKKLWHIYIYNGIRSHQKQRNNAIFSNKTGPRDYYTK